MRITNQKKKEEIRSYYNQLISGKPNYIRCHNYYWNSIASYIDFYLHEQNSILELGCGVGNLLAKIKGNQKVGIDFSEETIKIAKKKHPNITFHVMDAESIELTKKFDVIILSNLVGELVDFQQCLESVQKVCHEKTKVIVSHLNYFWYPFLRIAEKLRIKRKKPLENWLSHYDLHNIMALAGFENYRHSQEMLFPYKVPFLSFFINNFISRLPIIKYFGINHYSFARVVKEKPNNFYSVSIIIAARNESGNIENSIRRIPSFGRYQEIIFIEGNSTDDTWNKIKEVQAKYPKKNIIISQQDGVGKGDAVRKGFDIATGDILFILDADLTMPPEELPKFYQALITSKADFVNGSRLVYPMEKGAMRTLNEIGNKLFSLAFSWILEQNIKDTLCGTKGIFKKDYETLQKNRSYFGDFDPFGDFDLLFGAFKLNLKIIDIPIRYQERTYGTTNISRFEHGWLLLKMLFFATWKIKFRNYNIK